MKLPVALPVGRKVALAAGAAVLALFGVFAACGACGRAGSGSGPNAAQTADGDGSISARTAGLDARALRDERMWAAAKDGDEEDLSTLAVHEGALGLVEAASDPELRPTALRAMARARGWAQLPFLATVAAAKDDAEAKTALGSVVELAARPRTSEDPEDASELQEGCEKLAALARAADRERGRRIEAIRALRMMPCPAPIMTDLPTDVDAR